VDRWPLCTNAGDPPPGNTSGQGLDTSGGQGWVIGTDGAWIKSAGASASSSGSSGGSSTSGYSRGGY
jgi:hypothetical protein